MALELWSEPDCLTSELSLNETNSPSKSCNLGLWGVSFSWWDAILTCNPNIELVKIKDWIL